jgi:hypothetical protein
MTIVTGRGQMLLTVVQEKENSGLPHISVSGILYLNLVSESCI